MNFKLQLQQINLKTITFKLSLLKAISFFNKTESNSQSKVNPQRIEEEGTIFRPMSHQLAESCEDHR